jgi:hypothetical protein
VTAAVREARVEGLDALVLENAAVRVTVLPGLGGHVSELVDRGAGDGEGRDLLWHNPRTPPRPAPYGAHFDDWWSGGWDEIFPSGDRGTLHGEPLPYMGELWCVPWAASSAADGTSASITASTSTTVAPATFERRLELRGDEPVLRAHYRIQNLDVRPLPFTWGIHPAFAVTGTHRIDHPGREMLVGVSCGPDMGTPGERYAWPMMPDPGSPAGARDMRRARDREAAVFGGHWATDLPEGWLSLTDTATRRGVAIVFDPRVLPHAWLWQVYGGWRGHHHVALEAWTSQPMELAAAIEADRARWLQPGEVFETDVAFVLHAGLDGISHVGTEATGFAIR